MAVEVSRFCGAMGSNEHPGSGISGSGQKGTHYPLLEKSCPFTYSRTCPCFHTTVTKMRGEKVGTYHECAAPCQHSLCAGTLGSCQTTQEGLVRLCACRLHNGPGRGAFSRFRFRRSWVSVSVRRLHEWGATKGSNSCSIFTVATPLRDRHCGDRDIYSQTTAFVRRILFAAHVKAHGTGSRGHPRRARTAFPWVRRAAVEA